MFIIVVVSMTIIVSRLHACSFTGCVNMTSDKLVMTCECKVPHTDLPITFIQLVTVNEKTHHKHHSFLASLQGDQVKLSKYFQNYDVVGTKLTAREAVFTLEFDAQRKYEFSCTIIGMDEGLNTLSKTYTFKYHPADTTTTTTSTAKPTTTITISDLGKILGPQDESPIGEGISTETLTIIIIVSLLVIVIGLVVVVITAICRRRRSSNGHPPRPPNDAVPLEMVMSLLQVVTPSHVRGPRHITPSDCLSLSNGTNPSGSYATCHPSTPSGHDVILPLLRHHNEYTTNLLSTDVTGHATVRKTVYGDDRRRSDSKMVTSRQDDVTEGSTLDRDGKENHQYGNDRERVLGGRLARVGERREKSGVSGGGGGGGGGGGERDARLERHRSSDFPYLTPGFIHVEL